MLDLDDAARGRIEAADAPAFAMLFPARCSGGTCTAMAEFWQELGEAAPPRVAWRAECPLGPSDRGGHRVSLCDEVAVRGLLRAGEPLVMMWVGGGGWQPYAGKRSLDALAAEVQRVVMRHAARAATSPAAAHGQQLAATAAASECLLVAFKARVAGAAAAAAERTERAPLRPSDVPALPLYTSFSNSTVSLPGGGALTVAEGALVWPSSINATSHFAVLPGVVSADDVVTIRRLVDDATVDFDVDPDSVDGMTSHEIFVFDRAERGSFFHKRLGARRRRTPTGCRCEGT